MKRLSTIDNLRARVSRRLHPEPNTGCWLFDGASYKRGSYRAGIVRYRKRTLTIGRAAYIAFVGPAPRGLDVAHSCDNAMCGNPDHLRLATRRDNMKDVGLRFRTGQTKEQCEDIVRLRALGHSYTEIIASTGCSHKTVWNTLKRMGVKLASKGDHHLDATKRKISLALRAAHARRRRAHHG